MPIIDPKILRVHGLQKEDEMEIKYRGLSIEPRNDGWYWVKYKGEEFAFPTEAAACEQINQWIAQMLGPPVEAE